MPPKKRRIAVAINMGYPFCHHYQPFAGIQHYAREHADWECVVDPFVSLVGKHADDRKMDGVIGRVSADLATQATRARVPIVNIWSGSPARKIPSVLPDFRAATGLAVEHLLNRGYRRLAFHGFSRNGGTLAALAEFKALLRATKFPATTQLINDKFDESMQAWRTVREQIEKWIGTWKPPLGVIVYQVTLCRNLADICLRSGLRIPEDVGLIALGEEPVVSTHQEPSLSAIDMGYERVGYEAAALLDRLMAGKPASKMVRLIEPKTLIIRRSTDSYVVDDPRVRQALLFISEHSHEDIWVDDVARHVHSTLRSLERHFRAALGRTIAEEIARLRLERATRLLVESSVSIKSLARACGYSNAKYFHEVFFQAHGVSPTEYRRR